MNLKERMLSPAKKLMASYATEKINSLQGQVRKLQALIRDDILTLKATEKKYKGNEYPTYETAILEIERKYAGTADWGVVQTGNIIDLRAAFIINEGPKIVKKTEDADKEYDFVQRLFKYNDLDKEVAHEFAKEAELEGKLALKLAAEEIDAVDENGKEIKDYEISIRFLSWTDKRYDVIPDEKDYLWYKQLKWKPKGSMKEEVLEEKDFVYKKFGGRINQPNVAAPKIMKCLTQIESLDKALRDWREINRIFAGPILVVEVKDKKEAELANEAIDSTNFKIRKIFVASGKLYYAQFDIGGIESLEKEIITLAKMISGTTGIPVHFLGLPDLMSNRATAENLMELISASTRKERETWKGAYEEIIHKAMDMYNELALQGESKEKKLDPNKIGVEIPVVTREEWEHLEKVFLPAAIAGKISDELFLEKIPGVDMDEEQKRKDEKEKSELKSAQDQIAQLEAEKEEKEIFGNMGGKENAIPK